MIEVSPRAGITAITPTKAASRRSSIVCLLSRKPRVGRTEYDSYGLVVIPPESANSVTHLRVDDVPLGRVKQCPSDLFGDVWANLA